MLDELRRVDPDRLTPIDALALLAELRRRLREGDVFIAMGAGDVHEVAEQLVSGEAA